MQTQFPRIHDYNQLGRSFLTSPSINKDELVVKLKNYPQRGKLLAHLINFKMYRTTAHKNNDGQENELKRIHGVIEKAASSFSSLMITFEQIQQFARNRSIIFQKQLPSHLKQAINDLINSSDGKQYLIFLNNLAQGSMDFLQENEVNVSISALSGPSQNAFIEELKNCSSIGPDGKVLDASIVIKVLDNFADQLASDIRNDLVITLIDNCSGIGSNGKVRDAGKAIEVLDNFADQLTSDIRNNLVGTLIDNCSSIGPNGEVQDITAAIRALDKFGDQLDIEVRNSLIETLIENYNRLINFKQTFKDDSICRKLLKLLKKFGDQFDRNKHLTFIEHLIKYSSNINSSEVVHNARLALQLLNEFKDQLGVDTFKTLAMTLIENCSGVNSRVGVRDFLMTLELLNKYKMWLSMEEHRKFYRQIVGSLFDSAHYHEVEFIQLLNFHGEIASKDIIRNTYIHTSSFKIAKAIRDYLQGSGQSRNINLPPRTDILNEL